LSTNSSVMPTETQPLVFRKGVLVEPSSHDGQLKGIIWSNRHGGDSTRDLTIRWSDLDNASFEVTLPEIVAMRFTDLMEGNIIFEFEAKKAEELADVELGFLCGYGGPPEPSTLPSYRTKFEGATAFLLSSSYGCEGIAIAKSAPSEWICKKV